MKGTTMIKEVLEATLPNSNNVEAFIGFLAQDKSGEVLDKGINLVAILITVSIG